MMVLLLPSLLLLLQHAFGSPISERLLHGRSQFTEVTLARYLEHFSRLSRLHQEINGMPAVTFDFSEENLQPVGGRPDQLPYLFEGDIILSEEQMNEQIKHAEGELSRRRNESIARNIRSLTSNLALRWTSFPIPYYISGPSQTVINNGINRWQQLTCITFQQLSSPPRGNGLVFIRGSGYFRKPSFTIFSCYSYIGRTGYTSQQVSIGYGCESLGTVMHEIGHALGFYHEQARSDRDSYVAILTRNIQSTYLSQFSKQSPSSMNDYGVAYDYGSVMHYDQLAFANDRSGRYPSIQTLDSNYQNTIGQRVEAGFADVKKINLAYCSSRCQTTLPCQNGGYTDPKNCAACRCPDGLGGTYCTQAAVSYSGCPSGNLQATNSWQRISASGPRVCNILITAPQGSRVYFQVNSISFPYQSICSGAYLELKYNADLARTGARLCSRYPGASFTGGNKLLVIFRGSSSGSFQLSFAAYSSDTSAPEEETTDTPLPLTSVKPTEAPVITTQEPEKTSTLPDGVVCAPWNACDQPCGACGRQQRICTTGLETQICNYKVCPGKRCCEPFTATVQGICISKYNSSVTFPHTKTIATTTVTVPTIAPIEPTTKAPITAKPTKKPKANKKTKKGKKKPQAKQALKLANNDDAKEVFDSSSEVRHRRPQNAEFTQIESRESEEVRFQKDNAFIKAADKTDFSHEVLEGSGEDL